MRPEPDFHSLLNCLHEAKDPHPRGRKIASRAKQLIPGGAHTYAKGDDQYPFFAPPIIVRGQGCHVWDADGHEYIEYGMGLRAVTLGHAHPRLIQAATHAMLQGTNFTRPSPAESYYAEELLQSLPHADMVKFAKNGSDVTTAAVKLARAYTNRPYVAICADHPFFSVDDWFIGTTACSAGIPAAISDLTLKFPYGDLDAVSALFTAYPDKIACVMMEVETSIPATKEYLSALQRLCHQHGALLVFDEIIAGFRTSLGGGQERYGVAADLSTYGKGIASGFALAALVGKRQIMERGGLDHPHSRVFLLSTTAGAETHALAVAQETLHIYKSEPVIKTLYQRGRQLRDGVAELAKQYGIQDHFEVQGLDCNLIFVTKDNAGQRSQAFRALFMQELAQHGVLAPSFVVSYAHAPSDIEQTLQAVDLALQVYRRALEQGVEHFLVGPPVKPVMRKYN